MKLYFIKVGIAAIYLIPDGVSPFQPASFRNPALLPTSSIQRKSFRATPELSYVTERDEDKKRVESIGKVAFVLTSQLLMRF